MFEVDEGNTTSLMNPARGGNVVKIPGLTHGHRASLWISHAAIGAIALAIGANACQREPREVMVDGNEESNTVRVTGLGGVFFKSGDPKPLLEWYRTHLGIDAADWGGFAFQWREREQPEEIGYTVWGAFPETTDYFAPSDLPYMLNFRVQGIDRLIAVLKEEGVEIVGEVEEHPNGKFAWIRDPEGRKVELWEPVASSEDPYLQ